MLRWEDRVKNVVKTTSLESKWKEVAEEQVTRFVFSGIIVITETKKNKN